MAIISIEIADEKRGDIQYSPDNGLVHFDPTPGDNTLTLQDQQILARREGISLSSIDESIDQVLYYINSLRVRALRNHTKYFGDSSRILFDAQNIDVTFTPEEVAISTAYLSTGESKRAFVNSLRKHGPKTYHSQILTELAKTKRGAMLAGEMLAGIDDAEGLLGQLLSRMEDDTLAARILLWSDAASERGIDTFKLFDPNIWKRQDRMDRIVVYATSTGVEPMEGNRTKEELASIRDRAICIIREQHILASKGRGMSEKRLKNRIKNCADVARCDLELDEHGNVSYIYVELKAGKKGLNKKGQFGGVSWDCEHTINYRSSNETKKNLGYETSPSVMGGTYLRYGEVMPTIDEQLED